MGLRGPGSKGRQHPVPSRQVSVIAETSRRGRPLSRPERLIRWLEQLPVTKGWLEGRQMKLLPAQRRFIRSVYGKPGIKLAVLSAPRGSGKTGLLAPLTLAHLLGPEAIPRGECYSAAVDRDQSAILYREMVAIIQAVPEFAARANCIKHFKRIEVLSGIGAGSSYEAMSGDAKRGHGLAPSFFCYDELGRVRDRELLDALLTGLGKQPGGLGVVISTQAPDDAHPLSQIIDDGLEGIDPSTYVQLHAAPADCDPRDPKVWRKVNFALRGGFLAFEDIKRDAERAARIPAFMSAFQNLRLNMRVHADERLIGPEDWKACGGPIDLSELEGRKCWGGLDLSSTTDLSALVLVFEGDPMPVVAWHWMPAGNIDALEESDKAPYRTWRERGILETTAGRAIDKTAIAFRLAEIAASYDLQAVGYDDWRFADLEKILHDEGLDHLPLRPMRQGFKTMGPCVDALEGAVVDRKIVHDNALLTYCVSNVVAELDAAGNRKLSKKRSRSRIDGAVCLAMALGLRATEPAPKVYDFSRPMVLSA
jgi:phage terminase large subunit-like protein